MSDTVTEIDSHYEMHNVKYMNCSPKIDPTPDPDSSFGLNFNLLVLAYLFILII